MDTSTPQLIERPPVIVIMGHIDHGKSSLLDYIRKTKVVASEAGGITQHVGAYEVLHQLGTGESKKITFLDTPGHAAFQSMRIRGAQVADVAILVVSAEEGVKPQTLEALLAISKAKLPYVVVITKIDKQNANVERVRQDLATNNILVEGYGGNIPCVPVSAKTGEGVPELLDMLLLVAALGEHTADTSLPATGVIIEASVDARRGTSATLIIRNGTLHRGDVLFSEGASTPVRVLTNHLGEAITEASVSAPVHILGCTFTPVVGAPFRAFKERAEAEEYLEVSRSEQPLASESRAMRVEKAAEVPLLIKADVAGSLEAVLHEVARMATAEVGIHCIHSGVGPLNENDVKLAAGTKDPLIIGFHVGIEKSARAFAEKFGLRVVTLDVIYDVADLITKEIERRRPRIVHEEKLGSVKILKVFNRLKDKQVIGGIVLEGKIVDASQFKIIRHEKEIGRGKIVELQVHKVKVKLIEAGNQCGLRADAKITIAPEDIIEAYELVTK